jgi:hypothetical protein
MFNSLPDEMDYVTEIHEVDPWHHSRDKARQLNIYLSIGAHYLSDMITCQYVIIHRQYQVFLQETLNCLELYEK